MAKWRASILTVIIIINVISAKEAMFLSTFISRITQKLTTLPMFTKFARNR